MKNQIKEFVQSCMTCQQAKPERVKYPGLLEPLPTPDGAWKMVTMDFIEGLPQSGKFNSIMVVVDKFTKYAHFIPLCHPLHRRQGSSSLHGQCLQAAQSTQGNDLRSRPNIY
jgi:hypothetical protein